MSCGIGCRLGPDPLLLWLWCKPEATAPIRSLAWEPPYASGTALEKTKNKNKTNKQNNLLGSSCCGSAVTDLTNIYEDVGLIPGLTPWVKGLVLL